MSKVANKPVQASSLNMSLSVSVEHMMAEIKKFDPNDNIMLAGHTGSVWCVTSTSDNSHIFSGSEDKNIIVWDGISDSKTAELVGHTGTINALEITPNDELLISGCWNGKLLVWDWRSGTNVGELVGHTAGIYCSKMFKDGTTLITGAGDYTAKMWNIESRSLIRSFNCEGNSVFGVTVVKDYSSLICGGWGGVLRVWDSINSDVKTKDVNPNAGVIQSLTSSPDSKYIAVGTRNNIIIVYNHPDFTERTRHLVHQNWVRNLVSTEDNRFFFSASADKSVRLFNFESNLECFAFDRDDGYVFGLHLSKDGTILYTGASDKILRKRLVGVKDRVFSLTGHSKCIMSISVSFDSQYVVSAAEDKLIKVWSLATMQEIRTITAHTDTVWGINLTTDMKYIISGSGDKTVRLFNFDDGSQATSFQTHTNSVFTVASTANSKFAASGAQDKNIGLYDIQKKEHVYTYEGHTDTVFSVRFAENGEILFSGAADYTLRIWSVTRKNIIEKINVNGGMIESIAVTTDMKHLVIGDRANNVHLWDFENRRFIKKFSIHSKWVKCVALSSDNNYAATASNDMMVHMINLQEKKVYCSFAGHISTIRSVSFTNDMKYLLSAGEDKTIRVWDLNDPTPLKLNQYGSLYDTFLFLNCVVSEKEAAAVYCNQSISPLRITLPHIYCYEGRHELLKLALENGAMLKKDALDNSPLYYALERNSQNCIDAILMYLEHIAENKPETYLDYCWSLRNDFIKLLKNRSVHLPEFLEDIFYVTHQQGLAKFGVPLRKLPQLTYKADQTINVNDFLKSGIHKSQEILVEFRLLPFPIAYESGSRASIDMLRNISDCPNRLINRASIILIIVRSRWNNFWYFILLLTLIYWLNVSFMMVLLLDGTGNTSYLIPYIITNLILLFYEIIQIFSVGLSDYMNFWNLIDLVTLGVNYAWMISDAKTSETNFILLSYIMVILNFLRGISGFRAFDSTRFYIRLIIRAIVDTIPFLVIFFYTTLFFGMLNWTSGTQYRTDSFDQIWKTPFELNMGSFTNSLNPDLNFLYFMLASVINVIIILNLLISILGNSYDRFQTEAIELGNLEMVELVLEIETLMVWRRKRNEKKFIQVCDATRFEGITDEWEGKLKAIGDIVKKNEKHTRSTLKKILDKLEVIEKKIK